MVPELDEGEVTGGYIKEENYHDEVRILEMLSRIRLGTAPVKYSL